MSNLKFHRISYEHNKPYAYFYIDNLGSKDFLERMDLSDVSNMPICKETIKAFNVLRKAEETLLKIQK